MIDRLDAIRRESTAVARIAADTSPAADVPPCPDWKLRDLIVHLGAVQRFWAANVRAADPTGPDLTAGDPDDASSPRPADPDLSTWMQASTDELVAALEAAADDAPCWTWWGEPATAGAVARHQVQEAAVHRWDAEAAAGASNAIDTEVASDAVDEFLAVSLGGATDELQGSVTITASDSGATWTVGRDGGPVADIVGTASDLLLVVYRRVDHAAVTIEGDPELAATFLGLADTR